MMSIFKLAFLAFFFIFNSSSYAVTFCETYSHVQMKEKYSANFLKKDMQGCFSYSLNPKERTSPSGHISIRLGNQSTDLVQGTVAQIAFETFTSFVNVEKSHKAISNNVDDNLRNIRSSAVNSIVNVRTDLANFKEVYKNDAIPQIKENHLELKKSASIVSHTVDILNQKASSLFTNKEERQSPETPGTHAQTILDPIEKEKNKWAQFNETNSIPFRSLEKISRAKNEILTGQLLKEIKTARFNKLGLTKIEKLPLLEQLQNYEKKENIYNQKLDFINRSPELTHSYSNEQINTIKTIAHELKNESEKNLVNGELKTANESIDMAYLALDIATSLPILASGRGLYELYTGKSLIDGHKLDRIELAIASGMILIDLTPASVISRGAGIIRNLGKVGVRLTERGIVNIGLKESLQLGSKYTELVVNTANSLIAKGAIKYSTAKIAIEHKLFFKFIDEETFFATKVADNFIKFEAITEVLAKEGLDLSPSLIKYLENGIHYNLDQLASAESAISTAKEYLRLESIYPELKSISITDLSVTRASEKTYSPFNLNGNWHRSNMNSSHRVTMSGENGLYTVIGDGANAQYAARAELELLPEIAHNVTIESKTISASKVLDLTDPQNLELLNIDLDELILPKEIRSSYTLPQMLGHLSKMNQYDAIIFPGTKKILQAETDVTIDAYKNLILLKGY